MSSLLSSKSSSKPINNNDIDHYDIWLQESASHLPEEERERYINKRKSMEKVRGREGGAKDG